MRKHIERVFSAFETNLIPIIVAVLASYVLFAPAQFQEIHRALAQRLAALQTMPLTADNPELWSAATTSLYTLGGLIALSVLLWLSCRANFDDPGAKESIVAPGALRFVSLVLAGLPFLAMAVGFYAASSDTEAVGKILSARADQGSQSAGQRIRSCTRAWPQSTGRRRSRATTSFCSEELSSSFCWACSLFSFSVDWKLEARLMQLVASCRMAMVLAAAIIFLGCAPFMRFSREQPRHASRLCPLAAVCGAEPCCCEFSGRAVRRSRTPCGLGACDRRCCFLAV